MTKNYPELSHLPKLKKPLKEALFKISPRNMLIIMATVIFIVEMFVMFILSEFPPFSREWEALLDSTILLLFLSPFYLFIYRPFWVEHQKQANQIRFLSQQLLTTSEEESKRIAQNIHDQCGQTLTALQFGIQVLRKQAASSEPAILSRIDNLEKMGAQLGEEFREATAQLRPAILDEAGLNAALSWQAKTFQKNYPDIELKVKLARKSDLLNWLDKKTEDAIYRISQEALTNIARHANASEVLLTLTLKNDLELRIEDNGNGFDVESCLEQTLRPCGIGLLGMRERATMVGARLNILSIPGKGTSIIASFPLNEEHRQ